MTKKYLPFTICFFVLTAASLVAAAFIDLRLDIALNNPSDLFARWFEAMGETPARFVATVGGVIIFYSTDKLPLKIFGLFANFASSAYAGYQMANYLFKEDIYIVFGVLFGLCIGAAAQYVGQYIHIPEEMKKPLIILSVAGIIVLFVHIGLVEAAKNIWGRVRFRDLLAAGSYDAFTPWYSPNGVNGNRSFPSGHTGGASMSYLMMLLPFVSEKRKKHYALYFFIPFIFTSTVAYTRLVMGAHYLSDVTVGGAIGFTAVVIAIAVLDKKFFNTNNKKA